MAEAEVIRTALQRREPGILDGTKKSSVALLLRGVELEMLFIKRAASTRDRFSGDVAFPGGKRDPGESGMQTVIREVHEEIGIDLEQRDAWEFLGQLHEQRLLEHVVCCYVFMQLLPQTPPLKLQASEVAGVAWVPLSFFCSAPLETHYWKRERFDGAASACQPMRALTAFGIPKILGFHELGFTALDLPVKLADTIDGPQPVHLQSPGAFRLWGFTFSLVGNFLVESELRSGVIDLVPWKRFLGLKFPRVHRCLLHNIIFSVIQVIGKKVTGSRLGIGLASRWAMYVELISLCAAVLRIRHVLMRWR